MKIVAERRRTGQGTGCADAAGAGIARAMDGAVDYGWLFADVFHDIDFAAVGPAGGDHIIAEHPERRPHALAVRDFYPRFDLAVFDAEFTLAFQARGSVAARLTFDGANDKMAGAVTEHVLAGAGVDFEFAIAPTAAAEIEGPFGGIGSGVRGAVEFVAPDQMPLGSEGWKRRKGAEQEKLNPAGSSFAHEHIVTG